MNRDRLADDAVARWLGAHPQWSRRGDAIARSVRCAGFPAAVALVVQVAKPAEAMDHHPDIDIRFDTVTFVLSTHSAGGLTALDLELAERIDAAAGA